MAGALPVDASGTRTQTPLPSLAAQRRPSPSDLGRNPSLYIEFLPAPAAQHPLNSIVIYEGVYGQQTRSLAHSTAAGFYDAAPSAVSRLTHQGWRGQSNKFETVYLSSGANSLSTSVLT
jgi:hypothetical protein